MQTEPNPAAAMDRDHLIHEQQLAAVLRELLQQIDIGDYRDPQGRAACESPAYRDAEALVERFGLTHEQLTANPNDTPPEYDTWHTGP
jgi:hypothetical protein